MAEGSCHGDGGPEYSSKLLKKYIEYAESAVQKCKLLNHINGAQKLERKCQSELKYLNSLSKRRGGFDEANVRSSNLGHYLGVVHAADTLPGVSHILQAFNCPGRREPLYADVVAGDGRVWVKVIARKAQALHLVWAGRGQYGERDLMFQAEEYITCTKEHPVNFVEPKVIFAFYNGVTTDMAAATRRLGIEVLGNEVDVDEGVDHMLKDLDLSNSDSEDSDSDMSDNEPTMAYQKLDNSSDSDVISDTGVFGAYNQKKFESMNTCKTAVLSSIGGSSSETFGTYDQKIFESKYVRKTTTLSNDEGSSSETFGTCDKKTYESNTALSSDGGTASDTLASSPLLDNSVIIDGRLPVPLHSVEHIELPDIGAFNQEKKNNSSGSKDGGYSADNITYSPGLKVLPTLGQTGETNQSRLNQSQPRSSFEIPSVNEVCTDMRHFRREIDTASIQLPDGESNQEVCQTSRENVANLTRKGLNYTREVTNQSAFGEGEKSNMSDVDLVSDHVPYGELLMLPLIEYSRLCSQLIDTVDNTTDGIRKVNLDVSSLITLVSAVTHGRCHFKFKEKVLSEQASDERQKAALPELETFLQGKELYVCETAVTSFRSILDLLGGPGEVVRAEYLLAQITTVPDNTSFRTQGLPNTGKIKDRSKVIFGTGDSLKAVTLTANSAFVRSARHQGCLYAAQIHPARALTEKKEETGEILEFKDMQYHCQCPLFPGVCPDICKEPQQS